VWRAAGRNLHPEITRPWPSVPPDASCFSPQTCPQNIPTKPQRHHIPSFRWNVKFAKGRFSGAFVLRGFSVARPPAKFGEPGLNVNLF
jgi:hypothetical protein